MDVIKLSGGAPAFDLALGTARPFSLELDSGASDCVVELGGVPSRVKRPQARLAGAFRGRSSSRRRT